MAVAFDAVASATGFTATTTTLTFSHTCGASATLLIVGVSDGASPDTSASLGVTYGGTAMTALGPIKHSGSDADTSGFGQVFYLLNPTTGSAQNVVVTRTGGSGTHVLTANAISYNGAGTPTTLTQANGKLSALTGSKTVGTGEMAGMFGSNGSSFGGATYSHTKRWDESVDGNSAAGNCAYQDTATVGSISFTITPTATDWWNSHTFLIPSGGGAAPGDPGWGYIQKEDATGILLEDSSGLLLLDTAIVPAFPTAIGSAEAFGTAVATVGGNPAPTGIPSAEAFGSILISPVQPTGITSGQAIGTPAAVSFAFPVGVDGTGRYLVDQAGKPWPFWQTHEWNLIARAGEHNETGVGTTTPLSVFTGWAAKAKAQGFNAVEVLAISGATPGAHTNGSTWDNVVPFTGGVIGTLNNSYWSRVDDLIDACANVGITVVLNVASSYAEASGGALAGLTTTNGTTYGTALGNRYKTKQNIIWQTGVDDFATFESQHQAIIDAIQATGDMHLITTQHMIESNTRTDSSNTTLGTHGQSTDITHDEVYSYNCAYLEVERDYGLSSPSVRPTLYANGHYDQTGTSGTFDWKLESDQMGWALTSGSKGMFFGSEATWGWESNAYGDYSNLTFANGPWLSTLTWFSALTNWQKLIPDFGSLGFITSTRGTKATTATAPYNPNPPTVPENDYLTGAVTADGKLAVIYTPRHIGTNTSRTITIDGTQMVSSYTAKWVDPYTGAITTATPSATSYTTPGNNSNGQPNWYLVLQEQSGPQPTGIASSEAFGTATAVKTLTSSPTGIASAEAFGTAVVAATLTASPTGIASAEAFGTASITATLTASPTGIASAETFGTAVANKTLTASPTGIASAEAFGTAVISSIYTASPTGIASAEAFGTAVISSILAASPTGIASLEAFGTPSSNAFLQASPTGIASLEAFGTPSSNTSTNPSPAGITSAEAFGSVTMQSSLTALPGGIGSLEAFGTPVKQFLNTYSPTGIASVEVFGTPSWISFLQASPTGVASAQAFGAVVVNTGYVAQPTGSASSEAFGTPTATLLLKIVNPIGIPSTEVFGIPFADGGQVYFTGWGIPI